MQTLTNDRLHASISQLVATKRHLDCMRVNVLGFSGVGKTSLIEALQCGYVRSLLRRTGVSALFSAVMRPGSASSRNTATGSIGRSNSTGMSHQS